MINIKKYILDIILIVVLGLFLYSFIVVRAPINMDEFSQYHTIICNHYENNKLNLFREACGSYDLIPPGFNEPLPLRTYGYAGSLASLYYYPLFQIWQHPYSARMLGYFFILLQALVLSKILRLRFRYVLIGLVFFFPYAYQTLIDTSILQFYFLAIFSIIYLIEKWFKTAQEKYIVITALLLFLLIYSRLSFAVALPTLAFIFIYQAVNNKRLLIENKRKMISGVIIASIVFLIPTLMYFFSTSIGYSGYPVIDEYNKPSRTLGEMLNPNNFFSSFLFRRFSDPLQATSRAYLMSNVSILSLLYSLILLLLPLLFFIFQYIKNRKYKLNIKIIDKPFIYYLSFFITILLLFRSIDAKFTHHAMMGYPFLILTWGYLFSKFKILLGKYYKFFLIFLLVFNLYFFIIFTNNKVDIYDDVSKEKVNNILQSEYLSNNYFYIHTNWGSYFYQALYGPINQSNLYIESHLYNEEYINKIRDYRVMYNRELLVIYDKKIETVDRVHELFQNHVECSLTKDTEVWGILIPNDLNSENPCR